MEMKACSQRPGVQSLSIRAKYEMLEWVRKTPIWSVLGEEINISRRDIEIQK